jgi:hypothetical protein
MAGRKNLDPAGMWLVRHRVFVVILLLACFFTLSVSSNLKKTTTYDEVPRFLNPGWEYIRTGRIEQGLDNPPLPKVLGALPLLFLDKGLMDRSLTMGVVEYSRSILFWARMAVVILGLVGGLLVYLWARRLYGDLPALFALFLYSFCPNMIAFSGLVTADYCATFFFFAAVYSLYRYFDRPSVPRLFVTGAVFGLAQLSKFTGMLLLPAFFILFLISGYPEYASGTVKKRVWALLGMLGNLSLIGVFSLLIINAGYLFVGTFTPFSGYHFESALFKQLSGNSQVNWVPIPLPARYLQGVDISRKTMDYGTVAYLFGEHGISWWYYYIVAFVFKSPIPLLVLLSAGIALRGYRRVYSSADAFLLVPIMIVFAYMSLLNKTHIGLRYVLPIYPFIFIYTSKVVSLVDASKNRRLFRTILVLLSVWYLAGTVAVWPQYIAYFNEFAGGPDGGYRILDDSNIDWGQNDGYMADYANQSNVTVIVNPGCTFVPGRVALNLNLVVESDFARRGDCHTWVTAYYPMREKIAYTWWVYDVPPPVDSVEFGYSRRADYPKHLVDCRALCDVSRPEQVFVHDGSLEFVLRTYPALENVLLLDVLDNSACRLAEISMNDRFYDYMRGGGMRAVWYSYPFHIPQDIAATGFVKVRMTNAAEGCDGWDIRAARVISV